MSSGHRFLLLFVVWAASGLGHRVVAQAVVPPSEVSTPEAGGESRPPEMSGGEHAAEAAPVEGTTDPSAPVSEAAQPGAPEPIVQQADSSQRSERPGENAAEPSAFTLPAGLHLE